LFKCAKNGVAGGESADVRVVLAGTEVILVNLGIKVLAGEHHIVGQCSTFFQNFAKRFVCIVSYNASGCVDNLARGAGSIVDVEIARSGIISIVPDLTPIYVPTLIRELSTFPALYS